MTIPSGLIRRGIGSPDRVSHTDLARFFVIIFLSLSIIGITFISMAAGYGTIVPQLLYFPILYTACFYPRFGLWVAGGCAAAYLGVALSFVPPDPIIIGGTISQALLFIVIAVGSVYVMRSPHLTLHRMTGDEPEIIQAMIRNGENHHVEFKLKALWSTDLSEEEIQASDSREVKRYRSNASKFIIARALAGFLNADGGDLFIGIEEDRISNSIRIAGLHEDYAKLNEEDRNPDGYRLLIIESIVRRHLPEISDTASRFLDISFPIVSGKTICRIHVTPAEKPVFVKNGSEEIFFIRIDASTRPISGKKLTDYIFERFV